MDIYGEVLGEAAGKKIVQVSLSVCTVSRQIEDIAEDIETQLLERIVKSPWFVILCYESIDMRTRLVYVR